MAIFNHLPSSSTRVNSAPRVRKLQLGKGYAQRAGDGINSNPKIWNNVFAVRSNDVANAIEDFFEARGGHESFDWTPPGKVMGKYVCPQWSRSYDGTVNMNQITAQFQEVFEA